MRAVSKVLWKPIPFLVLPAIRRTVMTKEGDLHNSLFCVLLRSVGTQPNLSYYFEASLHINANTWCSLDYRENPI